VKVESDKSSKQVLITTRVMNMVSVKMHFELQQVQAETKIKETLNFESFLPLGLLLSKIFREQHRQLFLNIEKI
jgi:hypothetical protein